MKKQVYYFLLLAISFLTTCKSEEVITANGTELEITIQDQDKKTILAEIDVYLFSDVTAYSNSLVNKNPQGYDYKVKSNKEGVALFSKIEAKKYYIYINYTGRGYTLNNYYSYKELENVLTENATTSIIVKLTPFNVGSIGFWTKENNLSNLSIDIWVKDSLIGTLSGVKNSEPSKLNEQQILPILYQTAGTFVWQAKGKNGCYWAGEINLASKDTSFIELTTCSTGKIAFWTKPTVINTHQKLTVVVNETEIVGEITQGLLVSPTDCTNPTSLIIEKPMGTYNYKVLSFKGECVWIGTFVIDKSCSESIEIEQCN